MRNDIIEGFKEAGVGAIQWPGGCAAGGYNWKPTNPSNDLGTDQFMQLCALVGAEPFLVGPGTAAAADSNRQWVTYVNDQASHPEWNLKYFKVGNEVWGCGGNQTEATYETNYLANYDVLSAPINGKKVSLVAGTGLIGNWTWLETELKNIGSKIDGIEVHDYIYFPDDIPCVGFSDDQYYNIVHRANKGQIAPRLDQIIALLDKYDPNKRIKIFEDEWGDWLDAFDNKQDTWLQQVTVMDAISTAEQLHLFMQHADRIAMAGLAQPINVIHSLFLTRASDGALVKTPAFYVFKMFVPHHTADAKWAPSTLVSENIKGNNTTFPVLSAGTTVDSQGRVNISLVNVDLANARTIQITLSSSQNSYAVSSAQVLTGPAKDSYNDFGQAEKVSPQGLAPSSCTISGKSLSVTLPPKSVVMLSLVPQ
jgi:alpha-N-arabinofuranosidase